MPDASPDAPEPTFVLIHGGAHGAWCWERLVALMEARGHRAVAMDLPSADDDAGALAYADTVLAAVNHIEGPLVLVAHSLGGVTAPLVAARRAVARIIFVAALLPEPGMSLNMQRTRDPEMMFPYSGGREGLRQRFFNACSAADADWAMSQIGRQSLTPFTEITPLTEWPDVPVDYVRCTNDHAVNPAWSHHEVVKRIGVTPVDLLGADHSPFLSRPDELADLLVGLAHAKNRDARTA